MKKLLTLALMGCGLAASAQTDFQIKGDFDADWVNCVPWDSKNNSKAYGTQPEGWVVSNVPNALVSSIASAEESNGGKAVVLKNTDAAGQKIPAYMTLGKTWATAETKNTTTRNEDGGSFGGISFTHHPDAIRLQYKRNNSKGAERASVIAYLWTGSWTQAEVPGNTAIGILWSWGTATKTTMTDRDRNVLGMPTTLGGAVTSTDNAQLVASVASYISESSEDWQELTAELDYGQFAGKDVSVEKLNVVISANDYFADRSTIVSGNSLTVDNVELVYYHALKQLAYAGAQLNFSETQLSYDLSSEYYDASKLSFTKKGQGATVSTAYDEETAVLTITVKGEDYDAATNADALTTYTIQFGKPLNSVLTGATFGEETLTLGEGTVNVDHIYNAEALTLTCDDAEATIEKTYDEATGLLTVKVTGSDVDRNPTNIHTYTFQFRLPLVSTLTGAKYGDEDLTLGEETIIVDHIYNADALTLTLDDAEATIEKNFDEETGLLTVTVTGSDVAENPANVHTYTFQFRLPLESVISGITYNDQPVSFSEDEPIVIEGSYEEGLFVVSCEGDAEAVITEAYDEESRTATITVTGSDVDENPANVHIYKFVFTQATGISAVQTAGRYDVYTLSGVQLRKGAATLAGLQKGIYVVNGKKVVVK